MIQATFKTTDNTVSRAPYTVTTTPDATTNRLPTDSVWVPKYGPNTYGAYEGITATGGTPYISGSSFKAKIREIAARLVSEYHLKTGDDRLSYLNLFTLLKGGQLADKNTGAVQNAYDAVIAIRNANPLMGLFGGAFPAFQASPVAIGNLYALHDDGMVIENMGIVRRGLNNIGPAHTSDYAQAASNAANKKAKRQKSKETDAALFEQIKAETDAEARKELSKKRSQNKAETKEQGVVDDQQLHATWCLPKGVRFEQNITARDVRDAELGLMILTMQEFRNAPYLGGRSGAGCGADLDIDWDIEINGEACGTVSKPKGAALDVIKAFETMKAEGNINNDIAKLAGL